jgi:hypothetical protein
VNHVVYTVKEKIDEITKYGKRFAGRKEYLEILAGQHSTPKKRALAMCFECMGYYEDGPEDCKNPICPLYGVMPYRKGHQNV